MNLLPLNNINFTASKTDKLIKQIANAPKTPRDIKTKDYIKIIKSLGYEHIRTEGSHFHYKNKNGEKIMFKGDETTIDPKMIKILRQQISQGKIDIKI